MEGSSCQHNICLFPVLEKSVSSRIPVLLPCDGTSGVFLLRITLMTLSGALHFLRLRLFVKLHPTHRSVHRASWAGLSASGSPRNCCHPWSTKSLCVLLSAGISRCWIQRVTHLQPIQELCGAPSPAPVLTVLRVWEHYSWEKSFEKLQRV